MQSVPQGRGRRPGGQELRLSTLPGPYKEPKWIYYRQNRFPTWRVSDGETQKKWFLDLEGKSPKSSDNRSTCTTNPTNKKKNKDIFNISIKILLTIHGDVYLINLRYFILT